MIDRNELYMSRKRGHANNEDCVNKTIQGVKEYTKKSKERLIAATSNGIINRDDIRTILEKKNIYKVQKQNME